MGYYWEGLKAERENEKLKAILRQFVDKIRLNLFILECEMT